jgi:hypothetical protein
MAVIAGIDCGKNIEEVQFSSDIISGLISSGTTCPKQGSSLLYAMPD